ASLGASPALRAGWVGSSSLDPQGLSRQVDSDERFVSVEPHPAVQFRACRHPPPICPRLSHWLGHLGAARRTSAMQKTTASI
ncbi:hypothetical protein GGH13_009642, partial [Coemansia sp. S155-1]